MPSFFFTNRNGAPYGDVLDFMNPLARRSSSCCLSSSSSAIESRITGRTCGSADELVSIFMASPRSGGSPEGREVGNTSRNSLCTMGIISGGSSSSGLLSFFPERTVAKYIHYQVELLHWGIEHYMDIPPVFLEDVFLPSHVLCNMLSNSANDTIRVTLT